MMTNGVNTVMFHHFTDGQSFPAADGAITSGELEKIVSEDKEFKIICAKEWLFKRRNNQLKPNEYCLSFDDNLKCQIQVALPILDKHKIKAFWFVYSSPFEGAVPELELFRFFRLTAFGSKNEFYQRFEKLCFKENELKIINGLKEFEPDRYLRQFSFYSLEDRRFRFLRDVVLSPDEFNDAMYSLMDKENFDIEGTIPKLCFDKTDLKGLSNSGHIIGLHSHTHPTNLVRLSAENQKTEYSKNKEILQHLTGNKIFCMAHPVNSYNETTLAILRNMEISMGFRSNPSDLNGSDLELPRFDHTDICRRIDSKLR